MKLLMIDDSVLKYGEVVPFGVFWEGELLFFDPLL